MNQPLPAELSESSSKIDRETSFVGRTRQTVGNNAGWFGWRAGGTSELERERGYTSRRFSARSWSLQKLMFNHTKRTIDGFFRWCFISMSTLMSELFNAPSDPNNLSIDKRNCISFNFQQRENAENQSPLFSHLQASQIPRRRVHVHPAPVDESHPWSARETKPTHSRKPSSITKQRTWISKNGKSRRKIPTCHLCWIILASKISNNSDVRIEKK